MKWNGRERDPRLLQIGRDLHPQRGERLTLWERLVDDDGDGQAPGLEPNADCFSCSFASTKGWHSNRGGRFACTLLARLALGERMALDGVVVATATAIGLIVDYRSSGGPNDLCFAHVLAPPEELQQRLAHLRGDAPHVGGALAPEVPLPSPPQPTSPRGRRRG